MSFHILTNFNRKMISMCFKMFSLLKTNVEEMACVKKAFPYEITVRQLLIRN